MLKEEVKEEFRQLKEAIKNFLIGSVAIFLLSVIMMLVIFGPTIAVMHITGFPLKECLPMGLFLSVIAYLFGKGAIKAGRELREGLFEKDKDSK